MRHNGPTLKTPLSIAGFGLIELLVSISIAVLVMGVIMARHGSYNGAVLLRSQAYEVALHAREIQLAAVSAVGDAGNYRNVYGVYYNTTTPLYYFSFRDTTPNDFYFDAAEQLGPRQNIDPRFLIDDIRLIEGATETSVNELSVIFERPNFDARFYEGASSPAPASVSAVEIDIRVLGTAGTGVGEVRTVEITRTGQITVQ